MQLNANFSNFISVQSLSQLIRYGIVGISQNAIGYSIYLFFTWLGVDPKIVVAISYPIAMLISFFGNKKYTFCHNGNTFHAGWRFITSHAVSYAINLAMLWICVDILGYPHQLVQLAAIFVCAAFLFIALKLFVFPPQSSQS